jgi:hypothetical protein
MKSTINDINKYGYKMPNVFQDAFNAIGKYYGMYDGDKAEVALTDYFSFYSAVTDGLNIRNTAFNDKIKKLDVFYRGAIANYAALYTQIHTLNRRLACMFNEGRSESARRRLASTKRKLEDDIKKLYDTWNIYPIETHKLFAKAFPEPSFVTNCGAPAKQIINDQLETSDFKESTKEVSDKEYELKKLKIRPVKNEDEIRKLELEVNELKIKLATTRKDAENDAYKSIVEGAKTGKFVFKSSKASLIRTVPGSPVVSHGDSERVHPNHVASKSKEHFTVYVPGYEIYKQYFTLHKEARYSKYLAQPYDMSDDEVIAYIFLNDVDALYENSENGLQSTRSNDPEREKLRRPIVSEGIINMYSALEKVAEVAKNAVASESIPTFFGQYLVFPEDKVVKSAVRTLVLNKQHLGSLADFIKQTSGKNASEQAGSEYVYFIAELFVYLSASQGGQGGQANKLFNDYATEYTTHTSRIVGFDVNNLIAFLNLPPATQNDPAISKKFGVDAQLLQFIKTHPLFSMIHINQRQFQTTGLTPAIIYDRVLTLALDIVKSYAGEKLYDTTQYDEAFVSECIDRMKKSVNGMKKLMLEVHIVNMYLNNYRDSVKSKDPITKVQMTKDGLVDIILQQNVSYNISSFFSRLFNPFKIEFIDGRIKSAWRRTFYGPKFKVQSNVSYWREFNALWVDYLGKLMNQMIKGYWKNFKDFSKPRKEFQ